MQHPELQSCSFYFNPCRDLLWLSIYVTEEPEFLQDLIHYYGEQLDNIKRVFVEELDWEEKTPAGYASDFLVIFKGLQVVQILLEIQGQYDERGIEIEELQERANGLRAKDAEFLKHKTWIVRYIDRWHDTY
jgi:hypothetical protein